MADTKISALSAVSPLALTHEIALNAAGTSKKATIGQVRSLLGSFSFLGSATAGSSVASITVTLPSGSWTFLRGYVYISGYSASGIAGIQFNSDTGNNYSDRIQVSTSVTNTTGTARASVRVATDSITGKRGLVNFDIRKHTTGEMASIVGQSNSTNVASATAPLLMAWAGTWNNTASLITSVTLTGNGVNLLTDTYMAIFGTESV